MLFLVYGKISDQLESYQNIPGGTQRGVKGNRGYDTATWWLEVQALIARDENLHQCESAWQPGLPLPSALPSHELNVYTDTNLQHLQKSFFLHEDGLYTSRY